MSTTRLDEAARVARQRVYGEPTDRVNTRVENTALVSLDVVLNMAELLDTIAGDGHASTDTQRAAQYLADSILGGLR